MSVESEHYINAQLAAFEHDPLAFMSRQPTKLDAQDNPVVAKSLFSAAMIQDNSYVTARDVQRKQLLQTDRAIITPNDKAENLVDNFKYNTLTALENAGLTQASLAESPWSDDYWGIYKGIVAARYADAGFPQADNWKQNYDYIRANPTSAILSSNNRARIDALSPAEKYDALIGDASLALTNRMWAEGKRYYDASGQVETWMGICHGWAPAAYMYARPRKSIVLKTPDNIALTFYPSDIKALVSLLWANVGYRTRFIGGRCNDKTPALDPSSGRTVSSNCFDTNPGTWHLAVTNQLGVAKRSMVMDVTFDYEVWNQPTYAYSYRYFNPQTRASQISLANAKVSMGSYSADKFKRFRSPLAKAVVGIVMTVSYIVETKPSHRETDAPSNDAIQKVQYYYDLELDSAGTIIGGEWYNNRHPDFLWTPAANLRLLTGYESQLTGTWNTTGPVPATWRSQGKLASANSGAPLANIVEQMVKLANS